MAHNNNIGAITQTNVSVKGSGVVDVTSDQGSIIGLRYVKDNQLGKGFVNTTVQDVGSLDNKNWFAEYIGALGRYNEIEQNNTNIKWGDYRGATTLGMKIQAKNESTSRYKNSNNAKLSITVLNGNSGTFTLTVDGANLTTTASRGQVIETGGFDAGRSIVVQLTDNTNGNFIVMTWTTAYAGGTPSIRGSDTVAGPGFTFRFEGASGSAFSDPLIFLSNIQSTRPYGKLSLYG